MSREERQVLRCLAKIDAMAVRRLVKKFAPERKTEDDKQPLTLADVVLGQRRGNFEFVHAAWDTLKKSLRHWQTNFRRRGNRRAMLPLLKHSVAEWGWIIDEVHLTIVCGPSFVASLLDRLKLVIFTRRAIPLKCWELVLRDFRHRFPDTHADEVIMRLEQLDVKPWELESVLSLLPGEEVKFWQHELERVKELKSTRVTRVNVLHCPADSCSWAGSAGVDWKILAVEPLERTGEVLGQGRSSGKEWTERDVKACLEHQIGVSKERLRMEWEVVESSPIPSGTPPLVL
jgi:hypothetical protein